MPRRRRRSRARASTSTATFSWPLPPSTTSRSGKSRSSRARRYRRLSTSYIEAKSSAALDRPDAIAPIARPARLALVEGHHRRRRSGRPGCSRCRSTRCAWARCGDASLRRSSSSMRSRRRADVAALGEALARVLPRHLDQAELVAALRAQDLDRAALAFAQILGAHVRVLELDAAPGSRRASDVRPGRTASARTPRISSSGNSRSSKL